MYRNGYTMAKTAVKILSKVVCTASLTVKQHFPYITQLFLQDEVIPETSTTTTTTTTSSRGIISNDEQDNRVVRSYEDDDDDEGKKNILIIIPKWYY